MRLKAVTARRRALGHIEELLAELTSRVEACGGHVTRAAGPADVGRYVIEVARRRGATRVVKSKSMATEEVALNEQLQAAGLQVRETDLGEYIIQLAGEQPSHIVAPAAHKTRGQIRELFDAGGGASRCGAANRRCHAKPDGLRPAATPGGVPRCRHRRHGRELPRRRDGHAGADHERGQRAHDDLAAACPYRRRGHRQGGGDLGRPGRAPPAAASQRHRPARVHVREPDHRPQTSRRARRAGGVPPRAARQRAARTARHRVRGRPHLHPLRSLPERLSGLPHSRRPGIREHLQRPDRRGSDAAARRPGTLPRNCPSRPARCAMPAATPAPWRSSSRTTSWRCAERRSRSRWSPGRCASLSGCGGASGRTRPDID